ncbi:unnamed protein product [Kuraishia capsulata CBS 1993]|uniref:Lysophospholipase NTE1 n=1 Tax=Kuraishia capsulata CBS 1993 TaxID=1382522 RepID=W6MIF9_9ASCO|nr:uncharacterized protein KUCA_T00000097001 [Kuraishia capsulata CBS 1993]CDK24137.1 unnamed protein product [Kuraishia capsulata CBS 1993]
MDQNIQTTEASFLTTLMWLVTRFFALILRALLYHLPNSIIRLLSWNFSITLSFPSLILILSVISIISYAFIRYKYLTVYSRLPEEPKREHLKMDLFLETRDEAQKARQSYLDEFLSAIKIFGYLETAVFQELTKSMNTQKFESTEMVFLDDDKIGFAIVVEGSMAIYCKTGADPTSTGDPTSFDQPKETIMINGVKYQMLNVVKSGSPLSSLIGVLKLLTRDSTEPAATATAAAAVRGLPFPNDGFFLDRRPSQNSHEQAVIDDIPHIPVLNGSNTESLPELVAIPQGNATISVIPKESFLRVASKYPKSTSHIIQMILTRLHRVTFRAAHSYLGMTREIFSTEMSVNEKSTYNLPSYLHDDVITLAKNATSFEYENTADTAEPGFGDTKGMRMKSTPSSNPGDLLSSVPIPGRENFLGSKKKNKSKDDQSRGFSSTMEETEEIALRSSLIDNIFKIVELDKSAFEPRRNGGDSRSSFPSSTISSPFFNGSPRFNNRAFSSSSSRGVYSLDTASLTNGDEGGPTDEIDYDSIKSEISNSLKIIYIKKGTKLVHQGEASPGLFYIIDGVCMVDFVDNEGKEQSLYSVKPGQLASYLGSTVLSRSFTDVVAETDVYCALLPKDSLNHFCEKYPPLQLALASHLLKHLNRRILLIDYAIEWVHTQAGSALYYQKEPANGIYIVLNGRFRSIIKTGSKDEEATVLGEHGQGESLGEIEVLTATGRQSTLVAVRDSESARIPRWLFEMLSLSNPSIMIKVSRIVAERVKQSIPSELTAPGQSPIMLGGPPGIPVNAKNYRTITILPMTHGIPTTAFAEKLVSALKSIGQSVVALNQASTLSQLGKYAFDKLSKMKQSGYFSELEEKYQTVVYVIDTPVNSSWTRTCISHGDCILLLADAQGSTEVGEYERLLVKMRTTARTELILIHPERYVEPGSTTKWLKNRIWVNSHHHIQMNLHKNGNKTGNMQAPTRMNLFTTSQARITSIKAKVESMISNTEFLRLRPSQPYFQPMAQHKNDFLRLARLLSDKSIGLVLGGGGARGISHIGIIKALEDQGIPVDMVGGTSIGAFVGGLYARDYDLVPIYGRAKKFSGRVSSLWRMAFDLTYPVTSYTTGHEFNRGIWKAFGDSRIEDFWLKYYCNSTNITNSVMEIHSSGYAWRYIRASMTLAGLLPPITDNGSMLMDGGYVDNLTVQEMKNRGAQIIFAVDVGSVDDRTPMNYGDALSGSWVIFNRWNPFSKYANAPSMAEIQMRLAYVASVNALEKAKNTPGVFYMRPPIDAYATLDFSKFDEIYRLGSAYAHSALKKLDKDGQLDWLQGKKKNSGFRSIQRRNSI